MRHHKRYVRDHNNFLQMYVSRNLLTFHIRVSLGKHIHVFAHDELVFQMVLLIRTSLLSNFTLKQKSTNLSNTPRKIKIKRDRKSHMC